MRQPVKDFKFEIGEEVETNFKSTLKDEVITRHRITHRERGNCQSGNLYWVEPQLTPFDSFGTCEDWFSKVDGK